MTTTNTAAVTKKSRPSRSKAAVAARKQALTDKAIADGVSPDMAAKGWRKTPKAEPVTAEAVRMKRAEAQIATFKLQQAESKIAVLKLELQTAKDALVRQEADPFCRAVTANRLVDILKVDTGTVQTWIRTGAPVVSRPDKTKPKAHYVLSVADIVGWILKRLSSAQGANRTLQNDLVEVKHHAEKNHQLLLKCNDSNATLEETKARLQSELDAANASFSEQVLALAEVVAARDEWKELHKQLVLSKSREAGKYIDRIGDLARHQEGAEFGTL